MNPKNRRLWILGASHPEMERIEALLAKCGEHYIYATASRHRVHPGSAYRADPIRDEQIVEAILVECDPLHIRGDCLREVVRIDHHRPGDLGYGAPPHAYADASSLGQVARLLALDTCLICLDRLDWADQSGHDRAPVMGLCDRGGVSGGLGPCGDLHAWPLAPERYAEMRLAAAADHCLAAAYRGQCPGVDPDALAVWRAATRAAFQGRPVESVLADVERAREALEEADTLVLGTKLIADMRGWVTITHDCGSREAHIADGYWDDGRPYVCDVSHKHGCGEDPAVWCNGWVCQPLAELPEAACRDGVAYVAGPLVGPDGRRKYTCSGPREAIRAWLDGQGPAADLVGLYGDPARNFAGGYAP